MAFLARTKFSMPKRKDRPVRTLGRITMMLSSRAATDNTSLPTPGPNRTREAPRGLLQRVLGGPNSFPEAIQLVLDSRTQAAHWPARTALLQFFRAALRSQEAHSKEITKPNRRIVNPHSLRWPQRSSY